MTNKILYLLRLNDMRSPKIEIMTNVALFESSEAALELIKNETVPPYRDGQWGKNFRQGGPLEWYNLPYSWQQHIIPINGEDEWAEQARREYREFVGSLPLL